MEQPKSTTPSPASCDTHDLQADFAADLELPVEPRIRALPPLIPLAEYCRRNRELREWFPGGIPSSEERWKAKRHIPFSF